MDNLPNNQPGHVQYFEEVKYYPSNYTLQTLPGTTSDMSAFQQYQQVMVQTSPPQLKGVVQDASQKRALRLLKNRDAAREYRERKIEYFKRLENRVVDLEKQNNALMEEIRALKIKHGIKVDKEEKM
ncbi:cyclic AMP-responsive element-binding protein-like [Neosynchiropus ocellatus]